MSNILKIATGPNGATVFAIGAVSGEFYVCHNGVVAHKSYNGERAAMIFDAIRHEDSKVLVIGS